MSFIRIVNFNLPIKKEKKNLIILSRIFCNKSGKDDEDKMKPKTIKKICINETLDKKSSEDPNFLECEQEIIAVTEREKDASVHCKLSKETEKLVQRKLPLASTGLNLCLEIDKDKPSDIPPILDPIEIERSLKKTQKLPIVPILDPSSVKQPKGDPPPPPLSKRLLRLEPGKVVHGFIPKEWVDAFIPKTGVTGFYTFLITCGTYLISKEIYVLEHNFYNGLGMAGLVWASVKYGGPHMAAFLDKELDDYSKNLEQTRLDEKNYLNEMIDDELLHQYQIEGQLMLAAAKRENIALQLEAAFRHRQMHVYNEVKKRLDYQVFIGNVYKKYHHRNLVEYVRKEVLKSITPEVYEKMFNSSIKFLLEELQKEIPNK